MKCFQWVTNNNGEHVQPECSKEECPLWLYKYEKCGIMNTVFIIRDIDYRLSHKGEDERQSKQDKAS